MQPTKLISCLISAVILVSASCAVACAAENIIINADFENGDNGWTISDNSHMSVSDGKLRASGENYESRISQSVSGMENGIYTLNAYVTNDSTYGICYLYAKSKGHTMASTSVPVSAAETKVTVPGIIIDNGQCDIGLYINGSQTLTLDNLSFEKSQETFTPFLKGGEISKITYVEDMGGKFYDTDGNEGDALQIMAENGFNLARIRLLNDPGKGHGDGSYYLPAGYMTKEDCFKQARRAKDKGMQIEFTFAYSDFWVDGEKQMVPHEWQEEINDKGITDKEELAKYLENKVYEYTKEIMLGLIAQGTCPEFVSIGNEVQVGILFNRYRANNGFYNNADYLARFLNAGAKAVRETSPETKIILHSDNGGKVRRRNTFIKVLSRVDYDVIGVSFYPYYNADVSIDTVVSEFASLINEYNKDVIIMETGYNWAEFKPGGEWDGQLKDSGYYQNIYGETQSGQRAFLTELYAKLKQTLGERCIGDLYWDPVMIHSKDWKIGWAIDEATDSTQDNVVPNSTIFDFDGKAVEGQKAMKYNTNATDKVLITGIVTDNGTLCSERQITVTVDGSDYSVTTDKYGKYIAAVPYPSDEKLTISANGFDGSYTKNAPYDGVLVDNVNFPAPEDKIISVDTSDNNDSISYTVNYTTGNENAKLFVALYSGGALKECRINKKDGQFMKPSSDYTVKAFLWDGLTPLFSAVSNK